MSMRLPSVIWRMGDLSLPTFQSTRQCVTRIAATGMVPMHSSDAQPAPHSESLKKHADTLRHWTLTSTEPILRFLDAKLLDDGRWWLVAVIGFGVYYVGSVVAAWFAGTLYSRNMLDSGTDLFDFSILIRFLASIEPPRSGNFVPLLSDFAHLNFSLLICLVAFPLAYTFLRKIPFEFREYFDSGTPEVSPAEATRFLNRLRSRLAHPFNVGLSLVFALFAASTFVMLARSKTPEAARWWGNAQFGYAGYYLAFGQAFCCYYAMWGFRLFLILNQFIRDAAFETKTFHPFHPDGYYGFQPLARLIAWQALLILLGGLALFSTFYVGYFGLEKRLLILVSMCVFTVGTGAALATPLWVLTKHVRKLRAQAIAEFEPQIHNMSRRFGRGELGRKDTEMRYDLAAMMHLHDTIKSARTVPFGLASLNIVILGYGLQAVALIRQFYAHYK